MRKKMLAGKKQRKRRKREGEGESGNIRERLLCYRCHERELFVLSFEEKSEPLLKHILERLSTGSPVLSSNGEGHRNIVRPGEVRSPSLSFSLSFERERGFDVLPPSEFTKKSNISPQHPCILYA